MFDITNLVPTTEMMVYCLIMYLVVNLSNRKFALNYKNVYFVKINKKISYLFMVLGVFILLMTNFYETDYFSYARMIQNYDFVNGAENHGEKVYGIIASITDRNYLLFRAIVWGGALLVTLKVFKEYNINRYFGLYTLFTMYFATHFISRSSLAEGIYFWGFVIFTKAIGNNKYSIYTFYKIILGIILMIVSVNFHNSVIFLLILTLVVFLPINNKFIVVILLSLPFLVNIMKPVFFQIIQSLDISDISREVDIYIARSTDETNWKGWVRNILLYTSYYLPLIIIVKNTYFKKNKSSFVIPFYISSLLKICIFIAFISLLFNFIGLPGTDLHMRTMWFLSLPLAVLVCYFYKNKLISNKTITYILISGFLYQIYSYSYSVYLIINPK